MIELLPPRQEELRHSQTAAELSLIEQTAAPLRGLSEREVLDRRAHGQGNTAPPLTSRTYRQIVVENVFTFINSCLFCLGIALGAPEFLRPAITASETGWQAIMEQARALTGQGLRVLLVAHHPDSTLLQDRGDDSRLPTGMRVLGLIGLRDELRPEARATLASFIAAGVQPKIISGDSPETVAALARQAGLGPDIRLVSGLELDQMDEAQFAAAAAAGTIFQSYPDAATIAHIWRGARRGQYCHVLPLVC
jgi:hypothetical protein